MNIVIIYCLVQLDLSEVDRDKVSGQASAEIPLQTYDLNSGWVILK